MAETARFCRAREGLCHRAEPVPQVGIVLSTAAHYRASPELFRPWHGEFKALNGALRCLLDNQLVVEVVMEHSLDGRWDEYSALVVPEWDWLPEGFRSELVAYAERGGALVAVGPRCARLFAKELGVEFRGEPETRARWLDHGGRLAALMTESQTVALGPRAEEFGRLFAENDYAGTPEPAASVARIGKGLIAGVYVNMGERYVNAATAGARDFLGGLVRSVAPRQAVDVTGSHAVDVTLARKDGRLLVNLVNTAGPHAEGNVYTHDDIPPLGPLEVRVRLPEGRARPGRVRLEPKGLDLDFTCDEGALRCTVPRLEIHEVVVVE